jgi:acylphosphatase
MNHKEEENTRLHAIIDGRVQGVGFRFFVEENAQSLGLSGWVRNRWDGTVEVVAEGDRQTLEKLLKALHRGPRASQVTSAKPEWSPATGEFAGFQIRMTSI